MLTGGYWDQFLLAPLLHGDGGLRYLAMVGYAGGTRRPCLRRLLAGH